MRNCVRVSYVSGIYSLLQYGTGVGDVALPDNDRYISVIIDQGGHHLDLFYPTEEDPSSVK